MIRGPLYEEKIIQDRFLWIYKTMNGGRCWNGETFLVPLGINVKIGTPMDFHGGRELDSQIHTFDNFSSRQMEQKSLLLRFSCCDSSGKLQPNVPYRFYQLLICFHKNPAERCRLGGVEPSPLSTILSYAHKISDLNLLAPLGSSGAEPPPMTITITVIITLGIVSQLIRWALYK